MNRITSRQLAFAILCAQIPAFVYLSGTYILPSIAVLLGLLSFNNRLRLRMSNRQLYVGSIALVLVMYIVFTVNPVRVGQFMFMLGQYGLVLAQYFLMVQVWVLFSERDIGLPKLFPLAGGLTLMVLGDKLVNTTEYIVYQASVLVYMCLFALYLRTSQLRTRSDERDNSGALGLIALLVCVCVVSAGSSRVAYQ